MKVKIAHLYYDLLNLYGKHANITALVNAFNKKDIKTEVDLLTVDDKKDLDKYDFIYIGSGSKENLIIALNDLIKEKEPIKKIIKNNTYLLSTGNSRILFGKYFELNKEKIEALNIFDYYSEESNQIVGESLMNLKEVGNIIGFQNRGTIIKQKDNHLFKVIKGQGNNINSTNEGYRENNFISTYLLGPILIRNPHLTEMIVNDIIKSNE